MHRKLLILLYKDLLVLFNDRAGLGYLFIMPVLLVFIMVTIQDTSFKSISNLHIKIIIQNEDKDSIGYEIVNDLKNSGYFEVSEVTDINNLASAEELIIRKGYKIFIQIPDSTTIKIKKVLGHSFINDLKRINPFPDSIDIPDVRIYFTPMLTASNKIMILCLLRECVLKIENRILFKSLNANFPFINLPNIPANLIRYNDSPWNYRGSVLIPNSTQHNVPAWTLFAMFFIVMSLAGNIIREREEGSFVRLWYMPFPIHLYLISKLIIYFLVGMIQLLLMLLMGMFVLPLAGFPALVIEGRVISILVIGAVCSLAAVSYGLLIGTVTKTYQQATSFGAISVVILAAIGGVWVPVMAMPQFMQKISVLSPLNWGLECFHKVLVANTAYTECGKEIMLLLIFFTVCTTVSIIYFKRNRFLNL
jgi:ABC-2 type transport system permease protein